MAGITLEYAQQQFDHWSREYAGLTAVKSTTLGTPNGPRVEVQADLADALAQVDYWSNKVKELEALADGRNSRLARPYGGRCARR